ncbi:sensor histidine kinase [Pseudoflavitalea rhizosphaerae]|uniref:sensor histidine kinase n=1 Tax=Pseudoflavitalea rhizosphaerae TaxID=1884793 RepID=UPI000F8F0CFA|nr:ATP-binding protein [Pseudoflavitalea rhizosphaerae]
MQISPQFNNADFHLLLIQVISRNTTAFLGVIDKERDQYVYVNKQGLRIFELTDTGELNSNKNFFFFKNHLTEKETSEIISIAVQQGTWKSETEFITSTGKTFWGRIDISPFEYEGRQFLFVQIGHMDRSKLAEDRLAGEQQLSVAFIDYASIGIVIGNIHGQIVRINPFALQLFGYAEQEVLGREIELLIPSRFHAKHVNHRTRFTNRPQNRPMGTGMDLYAVRKDGTEFPVEVSLGTYSVNEEKFVIAFVSDITIRKSAEVEIKKLNDELESKVLDRTRQLTEVLRQLEASESELKKLLEKEKELGELKSRFVSMASHEFRTPLSTILSSAYLLEKYATTESQPNRVKHIERIVSSVNMLTDILNDFLSVGKIEEGKIVVRPVTFNIKDEILQIIGGLGSLLKTGQKINYRHTGAATVTSDLSLLKHVMLNLVANAIKFSPELSHIEISSTSTPEWLIISVRDYGIGIAKEDLEHLFERFYRGANAVNIQGTGLGLHIVARYVELLEGSIHCDSELGKGTLFTVKVPLPPITEPYNENQK